jgi:hypothetical protein
MRLQHDCLILTNNELVRKILGKQYEIAFFGECSYRDILIKTRDLVYAGHRLYTHPLAGSVKPNETPYRSVAGVEIGAGDGRCRGGDHRQRHRAPTTSSRPAAACSPSRCAAISASLTIPCSAAHWTSTQRRVLVIQINIKNLTEEVFALKLELGFIQIKDIQFSKECKVANGTLFVDPEAVKAFVYDNDDIKACVKSAHFDIARPGESVRITPVKDVIEPRVKVEGPGGEFPGVIAKVDTVGTGKTHVLRGMAVVTAGKIVGFQEGIIDMTGPGADYTPFSKLNNLVMVCEPVDGVKQHEYEHAVRIAGLRAATFIGELGPQCPAGRDPDL